jgi:FkbM family methyltransferase
MPLPIKALQALNAREFLAILNDDAAKFCYAQLGEDIVVHYLLTAHVGMGDNGFYVDAGAFHPRQYSNTRFLQMVGWRGLNIDASAEAIERFRTERPKDINVCCGVGPKEEELTFYRFAGGAASTCSAEQARTWQEKHGWQLLGTSTVRVRPLNAILEEFLPPGQTIDYLNIDLEGLDGEVLRGFDFARYRPKVLTVELHGCDKLALRDDPNVSFLESIGYHLAAVNVVTYAFVDRKYWKS